MAVPSDFHNYLFNHQQIIIVPPVTPLPVRQGWNGKVGIFSNEAVFHGGETEKLLQGMMAACKLKPEDWSVFPEKTTYQAVRDIEGLQYLLVLGCREKELGINITLPEYHPCRFHEKVWIKAHALTTLMQQTKYKKLLWNQALKPAFVH